MKRTAWLTLGLLTATLWPTTVATAGLWQQLLRWAGAGWGDGYHAQTDTTGYAPLPGTWQHRPPLGSCGVPGCPHCDAGPTGGMPLSPYEAVETHGPQRSNVIERLPAIPSEPAPSPGSPQLSPPKTDAAPSSTPPVPADVL